MNLGLNNFLTKDISGNGDLFSQLTPDSIDLSSFISGKLADYIPGARQYDAVCSLDNSGDYVGNNSIQEALDDGKKRIYVRSGTYYLVNKIQILGDNILIIGENKNDVILKRATGSSISELIEIGSDTIKSNNISIQNIYFDGVGGVTSLLLLKNCDDVGILNNNFLNATAAIAALLGVGTPTVERILINGCLIDDVVYGVYLLAQTTSTVIRSIWITNNYIRSTDNDSGYYCFRFYANSGGKGIQNILLYGNILNYDSIFLLAYSCQYVDIVNNICQSDNDGWGGMIITVTNFCNITNNVLADNDSIGISIGTCYGVNVNNNFIYRTALHSGNKPINIYASSYVSVIGNHIDAGDTPLDANGIYEYGSSTYIRIKNNNIVNYLKNPIITSGTPIIIRDNFPYDSSSSSSSSSS